MSQPARVHTPNILQMEAVECGAAALAIVLAHYRRFIPLPQLRQECGVSRDGSKASNVIKAAKKHSLKAKGFSKTLEAVRQVKFPCIVFWEFNHFVVLEGFQKDAVFLNDPAQGHRRLTVDGFNKGFTGVVLTMEPDEGFQRLGRMPSAIPGLWRRLKGNLAGVGYMALAGLLLIVPGLAMPALTKVFLDEVVTVGRAGWMRPLLLAMIATGLLQILLTACQNFFLRRIQTSLSARLTSQYFWHLLRLPINFYSQRYAGDIVSRGTLNSKIARVLTGQLASTLVQLATMLVYGVIIFSYSISLSLIGLGAAAFSLALLRFVSRSRIEANMRQAKEQGMVYSTAIAGLQGMETVKASNMEEGFFTRWSGHFTNATNSGQQLACTTQLMTAPASFARTITTVLIMVVGSFEVIGGRMSIGDLVAFQSLMGSFLSPVSAIMSLGNVIQELQGDVLRLDDVLQNPPMKLAGHEATAGVAEESSGTPLVRTSGRLELKGIKFGYSPLDKPLIENFSLSLTPGQRVALVGGSGSGKSTVAKIVCGLYDAWEGEILLDGKPVKSFPPEVVHNSLAMVEQDVFLFEGTVRENLTLWDKTVPTESLEAACRDASILEEVRKLPGVFDGVLSEGGGNLSGGQRQRLEIARALVNNPSVLVLDEATSALDTETEQIVDENLRRRGCTCLIVAHRLSTIRDCNEIIVMDRGQVVERGTHQELWARGGRYADLLAHHEDA
jgi:ATP-binding cassette subfamily C protein